MRNFVYIAIIGSIGELAEQELNSKLETIKERMLYNKLVESYRK